MMCITERFRTIYGANCLNCKTKLRSILFSWEVLHVRPTSFLYVWLAVNEYLPSCILGNSTEAPGIHPVWSASSLSAWRKFWSLATHWAHTEDWSDWADAQADLSLRWAHSLFVGFVMRRLKSQMAVSVSSPCPWLEVVKIMFEPILPDKTETHCFSEHYYYQTMGKCIVDKEMFVKTLISK